MVSNAEIRATFTSFITKIIVNESVTYKKKISNIKKVEMTYNDSVVERMSLSNYDKGVFCVLEEKINYKKLEDELSDLRYYNAMKQLSDRQKLILYLSIIERLKITDIANIVGISKTNVTATKTQAIKKFLNNIKKEDG